MVNRLACTAEPKRCERTEVHGSHGRPVWNDRLRSDNSRPDKTLDPKYPSFDLGHSPFLGRKIRVEQAREVAVAVGSGKPGCNTVGVMLVTISVLRRKIPAPKGRVDLSDHRTRSRNIPSIVRPEMDAASKLHPDESQPWKPSVSRLCDLPLHIEMEDGFCAARAQLCQSPPAGVAHPRCTVAVDTVAHELDIGVILVGRPMALEIVEEAGQSGFSSCASK